MGAAVHTDLSIYEFSQCANELGSCVEVRGQAFFVDVLADCVPQGGFESLCRVSCCALCSVELVRSQYFFAVCRGVVGSH
jgi:hypothetical protein